MKEVLETIIKSLVDNTEAIEIKEVEKAVQTAQTEQLKNIMSANPSDSNVFASFKAGNNKPLAKDEKAQDTKKPEEKERVKTLLFKSRYLFLI